MPGVPDLSDLDMLALPGMPQVMAYDVLSAYRERVSANSPAADSASGYW